MTCQGVFSCSRPKEKQTTPKFRYALGVARQTAHHKNQASLGLTGVTWDRPSAVSLVPTLSGLWGVILPLAV